MSELTAGSLAEMLSDVVDDTETLANTSAAVHGEAHFRAGVFTRLRQDMLDVFPIAEPSYGDGSERFHICLLKSKIPVGWIEIRKAWLGTGEGWKANTAEQLRNLLWDVAKVAYQARNEPDAESSQQLPGSAQSKSGLMGCRLVDWRHRQRQWLCSRGLVGKSGTVQDCGDQAAASEPYESAHYAHGNDPNATSVTSASILGFRTYDTTNYRPEHDPNA